MKRYQVYLNPQAVSILDDFGDLSHISRAKIIRQIVDRVAAYLTAVLPEPKSSAKKEHVMDSLAGFVDLKTDKKTNYAQHVDEIYFQDEL